MAQYKTPAVYVEELPGFTNSIVEVETAVPVFIGYTATAAMGSNDLTNKPFRISSLVEYATYFGGPPVTLFDLAPQTNADPTKTPTYFDLSTAAAQPLNLSKFTFLEPGAGTVPTDGAAYVAHQRNYLYYALRLFYANGGGDCYVLSVGRHGDKITADPLTQALDILKAEPTPTMIVMPDAMSLSRQDAMSVYQQVLLHCSQQQNRVGILDVFAGDQPIHGASRPIDTFRDGINDVGLDFGAAYYPWIETTIVESDDVDLGFLSNDAQTMVLDNLKQYSNNLIVPGATASQKSQQQKTQDVLNVFVGDLGGSAAAKARAHQALLSSVPFYGVLMDSLLDAVNLLPPSGAIAGVYARTDLSRGVFKAPAGTGVLAAVKPNVVVIDDDQQDLNVPLDGKAINAIRTIPGSGVMVWGARTLNGNSQDTRYINVRRTMIMLEQSIKYAAQAFMFEPNTPSTWVSVESMINSFLLNQWKGGALFGSTADQAFNVSVGLGQTMTADDILNGLMIVLVKVALVRPAEFIVLRFQQTMPSS